MSNSYVFTSSMAYPMSPKCAYRWCRQYKDRGYCASEPEWQLLNALNAQGMCHLTWMKLNTNDYMKIQIRRGLFETNSSSIHSITLASDAEYDGWNNGDFLYGSVHERLVSLETIKNTDMLNDDYLNWKEDSGYKRFLTFDEFFENCSYIDYCETFDTEKDINGVMVHVFGYYWHDWWLNCL